MHYDDLNKIKNNIINLKNEMIVSNQVNDYFKKMINSIVSDITKLENKIDREAVILGKNLINNNKAERRLHKSQRHRAINIIIKNNDQPGKYKKQYRFRGLKNGMDTVEVKIEHPGIARVDGLWVIGDTYVKPYFYRSMLDYINEKLLIVEWIRSHKHVKWIQSLIDIGVTIHRPWEHYYWGQKSALALAFRHNRPDVVDLFIKNKVDPTNNLYYNNNVSWEKYLKYIQDENARAVLKMKIMLNT